jgi:hypothetical protein
MDLLQPTALVEGVGANAGHPFRQLHASQSGVPFERRAVDPTIGGGKRWGGVPVCCAAAACCQVACGR